MKILLLPLILFGMLSCNSSKNMLPDDSDSTMTDNNPQLTYLALGDSYTIGEGVKDAGRFPSQLIVKLNAETSKSWAAPKVIAQTGWTVDELEQGILKEQINGTSYDLVTLLIGVNDQYRGHSVDSYRVEFEKMLDRAIAFAAGKTNHVVVIAIPDWGITPFAEARNADKNKVETEIKAYNQTQKAICKQKGISFVDISKEYKDAGQAPEMLAADGLHPSAEMYEIWTKKLFDHIKTINF